MANGTAASYMKGKPDVDRVRLLGDIAAGTLLLLTQSLYRTKSSIGLKYLHRYGMVHGDLRGVRQQFNLYRQNEPNNFNRSMFSLTMSGERA